MKIEIDEIKMNTKHTLLEIAKLMKSRTIDVSNDSVVNWKNVTVVSKIG